MNEVVLTAQTPLDYDVAAEQLRPFLPASLDSEQIHYGQGEGQLRIEQCVWGVYLGPGERSYTIRFEEGQLTPQDLAAHVSAIRDAAESFFGVPISATISGSVADVRVEERSLVDAAERGDSAAVESLLSDASNPNAHERGDVSALIRAAEGGNLSIVRSLVRAGANVDYEDDAGDTPLNCAAAVGALPIVEVLIEAGADVDALNRFHVTPMAYAAEHPAVARALSEAGARPHDPDQVARLGRRQNRLEKILVGAFLVLALSFAAFLVLRVWQRF